MVRHTQIKSVNTLVVLFIGLFLVIESKAQKLKPHSLSTMPTGSNFTITSYRYSGGNILKRTKSIIT